MSLEIKKIYTDCPYVDEMVYYSKLIGMGTVLKLKSIADKNETLESLRLGDLYIACVEGTAVIEMFDKISTTALASAGIVDPQTVQKCIANPKNIPENRRAAVRTALISEYIENYEDLNPYYRSLHGLPPVGHEDYITDWLPPEGVVIDPSKPVHEMTNAEALILEKFDVLEPMIDEDPINRQYMRHLGEKKIDYYLARKANRFDPLYVPTIDIESIENMYRDKLDANKFYVLRTVYSEAYNYNSDYYDNFIAIFIVLV